MFNRLKVEVAERNVRTMATAASLAALPVAKSLLAEEGLKAALDADVVFSCLDRPWPRHVLNAMAYNELIPFIDGGIYGLVDGDTFVHADWCVHTVGPGRGWLVCIKALDRDDISLDIAGKLDDPDYIKNLPKGKQELLSRRNVLPFSMAVAADETPHFVGCISGLERVAGIGPQVYHRYPGEMEVRRDSICEPGCGYEALTATCSDLSGNLDPRPAGDGTRRPDPLGFGGTLARWSAARARSGPAPTAENRPPK